MAKAKFESVVIRPAVEEVREEKVVLELSWEEAEAISAICGAIPGPSPLRLKTGRVYRALDQAGIKALQTRGSYLNIDLDDSADAEPWGSYGTYSWATRSGPKPKKEF